MKKMKSRRESAARTKELELELEEMQKDQEWVQTQEMLKLKESLKGTKSRMPNDPLTHLEVEMFKQLEPTLFNPEH